MTEDELFSLSVNLDDDNNCYMPSFEIWEEGKLIELWDNVNYLNESLYQWLRGINVEEKEELEDKLSNFKKELLELFKIAIKDGIFTNKLNI
jgi:hypothetical protein